jgi:hypothetical protein
MRDAKEIWHFPDPANDVVVISSRLVRRNTLRRLARFTGSVPNFVCNAAQSFGKKWEKVCVSGFTWNEGHQTQNKKENEIMKNRKNILTYIVAALLVTSASSSPAAPAQTYHGTFTGSTFYCNGEESPDFRPTVTGTWNLIIDPQTLAQLTLNVFVDGRHDVAFGNNALILISHDDGVYVFSAFGGFATATLDTSVTPARFSWHVQFGVSCPDQNPFNSLTFFGVANRGGG